MKKALITLIIFFTLSILISYGSLTYLNNRKTSWPKPERIQSAFTAAVGWIQDNQETILQHNNPVLWWMIQRSGELTNNTSLQFAFDRYQQKYLETTRNLWLPLFFPGKWVPFKNEAIEHFDDYQKYFMYAISCDPDLEKLPIITAQLSPNYCDHQPLRPACATHQLMAFRFMQQSQCGNPQVTTAAVSALQARIRRQLIWDPRVVDVYLQRVLMLAESGATATIKPIWVERILNAQLPDGGWGAHDIYLELPAGVGLGFDAKGFAFTDSLANFHTTAQGVFLLSLLLSPDPAY